jgi:AraC-like DNA-binding protein
MQPSAALRPYVRCYWELEGSAGSTALPQTILPDGCPEMVFHTGDPFLRDGTLQPRSMFVGQMSGPTVVTPGPSVQCFGVRFEPAGAWALFRFRQASASGRITPQNGLVGSTLERQILSAECSQERIQLIERALDAIAPPHLDVWCQSVSKILERRLTIDQLCRNTGVGVRQFERMFLERVGVTPRLFGGLARFRQALGEPGSWSDIAAACGYYDQSHLIRDFRQFTGESPRGVPADLMSQSSKTRSSEFE